MALERDLRKPINFVLTVDRPIFCTAEDQHAPLTNMNPRKATTVHGIFRKAAHRDLVLDGLHLLPVAIVIHHGRSNLSWQSLFQFT